MNSVFISAVVLPGVVPLLLFLVFTYLHEQSRQPYFRAWQLAWAAYTLHFGLDAWSKAWGSNAVLQLVASLLLVAMALCILVSTRLTRRLTTSERIEAFRLRWYELVAGAVCILLVFWDMEWLSRAGILAGSHLHLGLGVAAVLGYSSFHFYLAAQRKRGGIF